MSDLVGIVIGIFLGLLWSFSALSGGTIEKINTTCDNNGGIKSVVVWTIGSPNVRCNDGANFNL